jgi:beta-ribofuranosylaminobenzene 5'-phosphate synthase
MKVYVKTPARLHLGLIDLNGDLGRMFGGLGVGIDHPNVVIEAEPSEALSVTGKQTEIASALSKRFFTVYPVKANVHINIKETIPIHVGLGSGTQTALAIARALSILFNMKTTLQELSIAMGRAKRTGVGTAIFEKGGFVVDGGKNLKPYLKDNFPPLIYRQPFPKEWRFMIMIPNVNKGLANSEENLAFNRLQKMSMGEVAKICHLTMLKLLPALAEHDIESFGDALTRIQVITGKYFGQAQGGTYSTTESKECIEYMQKIGAHGVGQSSWGPALYAVIKQEQAKQTLSKVKTFLRNNIGGQAFVAKANNTGAIVKLTN